MAEERSREAFLRSPLSALPSYWLGLQCGCGVVLHYPCKLLARRQGGDLLVGHALSRFRCKHCGRRPERVFITDDATGGSPEAPAWRLPLHP